jgi:hypothetical protein
LKLRHHHHTKEHHRMKGKIVNKVPPVSRAKSTIDWDTPAQLAKLSGQTVLAKQDVRISRITSLRGYTRPPFVDDDGRIIVDMRNSYTGEDGVRYGDVYLTWEPKQKEA